MTQQVTDQRAITSQTTPSTSERTLSVVLPTLDEAGNVGPLLEGLCDQLDGVPFEVIVVDDGSTDGTIREVQDVMPSATLIRREGEAGLATAVQRGLREAEGRYVVVMDSDGQHPPEAIPELLETAQSEEADLVAGSRSVDAGRNEGLGPIRTFVSTGARSLAYSSLPSVRDHGITDPMTGLFLVRRSCVDPNGLSPRGYKIFLEILVRADVESVAEVGYTFEERKEGESKLGRDAIVGYLHHLSRLATAEAMNRRLLAFVAIGVAGVLVNLGLLALFTEVAGLHYVASAGIALEASIVHNWALNDVFTFSDRRSFPWYERLTRFNLVAFAAMTVNIATLVALTEGLELHYLLSETIAILVAFLANWLASLSWVYPPRTPSIGEPDQSIQSTGGEGSGEVVGGQHGPEGFQLGPEDFDGR